MRLGLGLSLGLGLGLRLRSGLGVGQAAPYLEGRLCRLVVIGAIPRHGLRRQVERLQHRGEAVEVGAARTVGDHEVGGLFRVGLGVAVGVGVG